MTKQAEKHDNVVSSKVVNSFFDRGDGIVEFPNGLVITDDSVMWSGEKYDIESLDIDEYPGQLTLDHWDSIGGDHLIGKAEGVRKQGNKVTVDRIRYAIDASENALRAYKLLVGGFSNAFSVETIGPWADEETHTMRNHKLVGLSQVVMGNNKHAVANSINPMTKVENGEEVEDKDNCKIVNTVYAENEPDTQAEEGEPVAQVTNTAEVEEEVKADATVEETNAEEVEAKTETPAEETKVENEADKAEETTEEEPSTEESTEEDAETEEVEAETEEETEEPAGETKEVENAVAEGDGTEEQTEDAPETKTEEVEEPAEGEKADKEEENKQENKITEETMTKEEIEALVKNAIDAAVEKVTAAQAEEVAEPAKVEEPAADEKADNSYSLEKHVNAVFKAIKTKTATAYNDVDAYNQKNLEALKAEGLVSNSMTIEDWGNFVLPPEMWRELIGLRTDYSEILNATNWRETDRLEFTWLTRDGDIEMSNVAMCEARPATDPDTSNLKPITTYGAVQHIEQMEHLGAVTPICTAATKYLAVDLVADAVRGYRNNYDKKRAELVIAKLQEAVNLADNKVPFNAAGTHEQKLATFIDLLAKIVDTTSTGVLLMTKKTELKLMQYVATRETALGDAVFTRGTDGFNRVFGTRYIIVPSELMPSLESDAANPIISYVPVDASSNAPEDIEITSTAFYGDLSYFTGYTSGGLNFAMSEEASYEIPSGSVRSAWQRDEIVLRGYFYRGAAYRFPEAMAAITNESVSD